MSVFQRIITFFTSLIMTIFGVSGVSLRQRAEALRVTAYIVAYDDAYMRNLDDSHFDDLTDIILIGNLVFFDAEGQLSFSDYFDDVIAAAKEKIGERPIRLHLNFAGPGGVERPTSSSCTLPATPIQRRSAPVCWRIRSSPCWRNTTWTAFSLIMNFP